jgi:hypothetical protein
VLEGFIAVFSIGTLILMFDLGWRLQPLILEKNSYFGITGWFTALVLGHRTAIAGAFLMIHISRIAITSRMVTDATRWIAWLILAGIQLMAVCFWFFMVAATVISSAPL